MHLFLWKYEKLQFDRESEESFQEKRTTLSGVPLRLNIPIERHASKIYTRSMFEQFSEALYKSFAHQVDVIEHRKVYKVTHLDAAAREKWSKIVFIVNVDDEARFFDCECGTFEHSGMVCCHSLKVMIEFRLPKIPDKHVVKRWTRDARDILLDHLVRYQKDRGPPASDTFRHSQMWIRALECVRLSDINVKCYDVFMAMMKEVYATLLPLSHDKDGMGLEERDGVAKMASGTACSDTVEHVKALVEDCGDQSYCSGIAAANCKRASGRPTTSRDKAPCEEKMKRSRFCKICRKEGQKCTTCPDRSDIPKAPRKEPKFTKCGVIGHRRNVCGKPTDPFEPNFL